MSDTAGRNIPLLRGFYVANAANTMIMPVVVLYWLNHGLSMSEVLFLQGFFAVCVALLELPSGYFSDWFSRRVTLMLSGFFTALGLGIYLVATDFWSFLPAEVCFALGMSLLSGTLEAMAYESCPPATRATEGPRVLGALQERYFIMLAVYSVAGSAVAAWLGIEWTIALAAAVVLSSCVFAVCLVEPERVRARDLWLSPRTHLWTIFSDIRTSRLLLFNFLVFGGLLAINRLGFWYYQPLMVGAWLDTVWLGAVFSIFYLFVAFGNRIARMVVAKFGSLSAVYLQVGLLGVGYLIMAAWTTSLGWLAIALPRTVFGMTSYLQASNINAAVSDDRRATVHSAASFTARVVYAGLLFLSGAFIGDWPLSSVFLALAGYTVVLSAFVVVFGSRVYFLRESAA